MRACPCKRSIQEPKKQEEGGERDLEREILTDFAVGIGLFSAGTEVRIPPPAGLQSVTSNRTHWSPLY